MRLNIVSIMALSLVAVGCGKRNEDTSTTDTGTTTTDTGTTTTDTGTTTTDTGTTTTDTGTTTTDTGSTGNTAPSAPEIAVLPTGPSAEDDLICTIVTESEDDDGDAVDYTFSWQKDGVDWTGFTKDTVYTGDSIGFRATAEGEEWTCIVVPNDGMDDGDVAEDSVTISSSGPDTGSGSDTALFTYYWEGEATITRNGGNYTEWNGTESFVIYNVTDTQVACEEAYDTSSTTTLSGCSDCDFAFDVTYSDSVVTGPGCTAFGFANQSGDFSSRGWGFASTYTVPNGGSYSDVLMYYSPNDGSWFGVSLATKTMNGSDVDLAYSIYSQYYFYYYTY